MGVVYLARDERLDRKVALKFLPSGALAGESARNRFRKEALALAKVNHPHVAMIYDFDTQDGVAFLVMEFIRGETLSDLLAAGQLREKDIVRIGSQIAEARQEAHDQGIVHRDLKPRNVIIASKGQAKVLDFSLARLLQSAGERTTADSVGATHSLAGTLPYMAPEQLQGEAADARTDIGALGAVLYEMATGRRPFDDPVASRLTYAILHQPPVPPRAPNSRVSPGLEHIILKCLEKRPDNRYQSAKEIPVDLRRLQDTSSGAATQVAVGTSDRVPALNETARSSFGWELPRSSFCCLLPDSSGVQNSSFESCSVEQIPPARPSIPSPFCLFQIPLPAPTPNFSPTASPLALSIVSRSIPIRAS
jgi:eukaryotic-like serine/threonine-protein kinase